MRNYFILDGVDSRDFGVYISGQGTFSASGRDYNIIPVPGRNGDLVGPEKRFLNGTLTYPAFIYANFKQQIEAFRNFLLSLVGYHDLIDSYHPNEIRKVLFEGPFEADVEPKNDAGRFDIEFKCKPQRYLASGNEVTTFDSAGETETFSGSIVTFDNPDVATVNALSTAINPIQDLHGYDNPWPAGGGTNKYNQETATNGAIYSNGVVDTNTSWRTSDFIRISGSAVTMSWESKSAYYQAKALFFDTSKSPMTDSYAQFAGGKTYSHTWQIPSGAAYVRLSWSVIVSDASYPRTNIRVNIGTADLGYAPYSNICPISGFTKANIVVSPTQDAQDGTTYTVQFGAAGTVYGGTLDAVNGTMTITQVKAQHSFALPTRQENGRWILSFYPENILSTLFGKQWAVSEPPLKNLFRASNLPIIKEGNLTSADSASVSFYGHNAGVEIRPRFLASQFSAEEAQTIASAMEFVYPINPITITLDPVTISTISGQTNNVWANTGDITATIEFPQCHFTITNPTLFDSQPLLRVYGTGTLGIGSQSVTITQADVYTDIDCEMMDAFKGTENRNAFVSVSGYKFPVLAPGANGITLGTGITRIIVTPRFWTV